MSEIYQGIDPIPQPPAVPGKGEWLAIQVPTDDDDITAASLGTGLEGLKDCANWLAWRHLGVVFVVSLGDGSFTVDWDVAYAQVLYIHTTQACTIDIVPTNIVAGGRYAVVIEHFHNGAVPITWSGDYYHRFKDGEAVDGQLRPGGGTTMWVGTAHPNVAGGGPAFALHWSTEKGNVAAGSFRHIGAENTGCRVDAAGAFVMTKELLVDELITAPGESFPVWTTPSQPYVIEGASITLTANGSASGATPTTPTVYLLINDKILIQGLMDDWGGTTYDVTTKRSLFGADPDAEHGELLTGDSLTGNGAGDLGAQAGGGQLRVESDGGANGFWGKALVFRVEHGASVSLNIPLRLRVWGRLLV